MLLFGWIKQKYDQQNYNNISGIIGSKEVVGNPHVLRCSAFAVFRVAF